MPSRCPHRAARSQGRVGTQPRYWSPRESGGDARLPVLVHIDSDAAAGVDASICRRARVSPFADGRLEAERASGPGVAAPHHIAQPFEGPQRRDCLCPKAAVRAMPARLLPLCLLFRSLRLTVEGGRGRRRHSAASPGRAGSRGRVGGRGWWRSFPTVCRGVLAVRGTVAFPKRSSPQTVRADSRWSSRASATAAPEKTSGFRKSASARFSRGHSGSGRRPP